MLVVVIVESAAEQNGSGLKLSKVNTSFIVFALFCLLLQIVYPFNSCYINQYFFKQSQSIIDLSIFPFPHGIPLYLLRLVSDIECE